MADRRTAQVQLDYWGVTGGNVLTTDGSPVLTTPRKIRLWFISLLFAVGLFSLPFIAGMPSFEAIGLIFITTLGFALPVACLYLPIVIGLSDAEKPRIWIIPCGGILIGPALMALWCFVLLLRGDDPQTVWHGDPLLGIGGLAGMVFAAIVGSFTTLFYVIALKVIHQRHRKSANH
jgi:hypothetical protein